VDHRARIMTWNLWWRFGPRWEDRQPAILETLRRARPDVLVLQEVWAADGTTQADELAGELDMHVAFGAPSYPLAPSDTGESALDNAELGIAVLTKWPIIDATPVVMPARHRSWDPVALVISTEHPAGPMHVIGACLDFGVAFTDDRIAQGTLLAELATAPERDGPCPVVIAGDLNAAAGSPVLRSIQDVLVDAWDAGGGDPDAVTLPSTHPSAPMEAGPQMIDQRIDHVFYRSGREDQRVIVEGVRLAGDSVDGVYPSDHRAVVADLRWRG